MAENSRDGETNQKIGMSRRTFVTKVAATSAGIAIVPRHVLGRGVTPPSDRLNIAVVGVGGQGRSNMINLASQNIVSMCDVDWDYAGKAFDRLEADIQARRARLDATQASPARDSEGRPLPAPAPLERERSLAQIDGMQRLKNEHLPRATRHQDYRVMLEREKSIDAVVVATPDHMHASIALAAMDLGKHVFVQKPLTWSVAEARQLAKRARENRKLATQMGNQGHSWDDARTAIEYVWAGAIGDVREIHVWTNRPLGYWPQGIPRPEPLKPSPDPLKWNGPGVSARLANALYGDYKVPSTLAWDLFLGVAPYVEYHPIYHPFNWRGWTDWGVGAIGDMGAHLIDHSMWALDLGYPTTVETVATPFNGICYPHATMTHYEFPARGDRPSVKMTWYDGGMMPPKPDELGEENLPTDGGIMYVGSKGKMLQETYGERPRLLPAERHNSYGPPKEKLARVPHEAHEMNWVNAIRGQDEISSPFSYAAHLTEIMLLGVVSLRAKSKLHYDGASMKVTNNDAANEFLSRVYREGYSL